MQTTFELNAREIDFQFIEFIKKHFKNKDVKIIIEEIENPKKTNVVERFKNSKPIQTESSIDLEALIKEASDPKILF
jgi:arsenate reductase-like glutaredoxin family protein